MTELLSKSEPTLDVSLQSGVTISICALFLYEQKTLQRAAEMRARAEEGLRGANTGLGFIGSPQWVVGGALILGAIESLASSANAKKAIDDLRQEAQLNFEAKENGQWFEISDVAEIANPDPSRWIGFDTESDSEQRAFVHPQVDFILVRTTENQEVQIRFSTIVTYRVFPVPKSSRASLALVEFRKTLDQPQRPESTSPDKRSRKRLW